MGRLQLCKNIGPWEEIIFWRNHYDVCGIVGTEERVGSG